MKRHLVLMTAIWILAGAGCETGYQPGQSSITGGYQSEREASNVFNVWYHGNGLVSEERASDLVLMRAAELTLEHGFNYLAVVASRNERSPMGKPWAQVVIGCFRDDPKHARSTYDVYKAADLFQEMAAKYEFKRGSESIEPKHGAFEPTPDSIRFEVEPWYASEPIAVEDVEYVARSIRGFDMDGTWVGRYVDFENPVATIDDFIEAAKPLAARHGANALVVECDPARIHETGSFTKVEEQLVGFLADLYVVPVASPGIEWEPGDLILSKCIIRRFRAGSKCAEAGLRLGDKVLAISGVDVLETSRLLQQSMKWSVGEKVNLTVVRDGRETIVEVTLVPNMVVSH